MKAEIIAIGSELTCGARIDTNSVWLSQELEACGWTVQRHTTVADDQAAMVKIFQDAATRSRIVLVTGGLGPTLDDITRDTLAEAFHQALVQDDDALKHIEKLFRSRNREMPERNKVQALRPENATMIANAHGTAPGIMMHLTDPSCTIAVMPGVPAEMKLMFRDQIQPKLPASEVFVQRSLIRSFGMGESEVERRLGGLTARGRNPEVGITASQAVISLSITSRAGSVAECDVMTNVVREQIYETLDTAIFGEGEATLHEVVTQQLIDQDKRIALLEGSTTGGILSQWMSESEQTQQRLVSGALFPSEEALLTAHRLTAHPLTTDRQTTGQTTDSEIDFTTWRDLCLHQAQALVKSGTADFVLISSPSNIQTDEQGIASKLGQVVLVGADIVEERDVSMAGNLAIFRHRASRTVLNLLRLHLLAH